MAEGATNVCEYQVQLFAARGDLIAMMCLSFRAPTSLCKQHMAMRFIVTGLSDKLQAKEHPSSFFHVHPHDLLL